MINFSDYVQDPEDYEKLVEYYQWFVSSVEKEYPEILDCRPDYKINTSHPMLLTRSGNIVDVERTVNGSTHSDFAEAILKNTLVEQGIFLDDDVVRMLSLEFLGTLIQVMGWILINPGTAAVAGEAYIALSLAPNKYQKMALEDFFNDHWSAGNKSITVHIHKNGKISYQDYTYNNTFPEDIVKKISAFFSTGFLSESVIKDFKKMPYIEWLREYLGKR